MQLSGRAADASRLILDTRAILDELGADQDEIPRDQLEVTLLCDNAYGSDLRTQGRFNEALQLDRGLLPKFEAVFGPDHERTLNVRNNIAADYRRLGRFGEAFEIDQRTFDDRCRILGPNDPRTLNSQDMLAIDLRGLGRYQESLDEARKVVTAFEATGDRENPDWLNARTGFAAALRKAGHHWDALQWSEDVVQRYRDYLGMDHAHTLRAAVNLVNDRRAVGELTIAEDLAKMEHDRWVRDKERDGWRYGPERNDEQKLHPLMVPWEELPDEQRDKDRNPMRELPRILGRVGLQIERGPLRDSAPPAAEEAHDVPGEVVDVG